MSNRIVTKPLMSCIHVTTPAAIIIKEMTKTSFKALST